MLTTAAKKPVNKPGWTYEIKWDGYRVLAYKEKDRVTLSSRAGLTCTAKYRIVAHELKKIKHDFVFDGEIVVATEEGRPSFNALQNYQPGDPIIYYVFDLLWLDGYDLMDLELQERKNVLKRTILNNEVIRFSDSFDDGELLFKLIKSKGMEGIVEKRLESRYLPGKRSPSWIKVPIFEYEDYIIVGWGESARGRAYRTLLLGKYDKGRLKYIEQSGHGMSAKESAVLLATLRKIEVRKCPVINPHEVSMETPVHWCKPMIIGEFEQTNKRTPSGAIRHPVILKRVRFDLDPKEITV